MDLKSLGFDDARREELAALDGTGLEPARVGAATRDRCQLLGLGEPVWATLRGRLSEQTDDRLGLPAVGDWVLARRERDAFVVEQVLDRRSAFVRKAAGKSSLPQVVATNLDRVFAVTAVGPNFNPRRIERYLSAIWNGGAEPVVVVNKTDLPHDPVAIIEELGEVALGVRTALVSAFREGGIDELLSLCEPGMTIALVGSSGVGKSTIVNQLLGHERQATNEVRNSDHKGRHTTSDRQLFVAPSGSVLVDTPGMRELGLWNANDGVDRTFADLLELAEKCQFRDCAHDTESGCAVLDAVARGELSAERLESFQRLLREIAHNTRRTKENSKRRWKWIAQAKRDRARVLTKSGVKK
ncbi:MAG: ribosome small subunit-dependent GTPase A [Deltaproteobacteria bacterium]|nr:ribosome small subunit-dependent GTPase A [Deltaproteobacteria bacterium]